MARFKDLNGAVGSLSTLLRASFVPSMVNFWDQSALRIVESELNTGIDPAAGLLVVIETDGPAAQAQAEAEAASRICRENNALEVNRPASDEDREAMRRIRRAALPVGWRAVVPGNRLPEMMARLEGIGRGQGLDFTLHGQAGDRGVLVKVFCETAHSGEAFREASAAARELGGAVSGESTDLDKRIKSAFDPDGIMNPGRMLTMDQI